MSSQLCAAILDIFHHTIWILSLLLLDPNPPLQVWISGLEGSIKTTITSQKGTTSISTPSFANPQNAILQEVEMDAQY